MELIEEFKKLGADYVKMAICTMIDEAAYMEDSDPVELAQEIAELVEIVNLQQGRIYA